MDELASLDLFVEITTPDGATFKWGPNEQPDSRLLNLSFTTKIGEGFSTATGRLARLIGFDYPDLQLLEQCVIRGADGHIVFEGYLAEMPRELSDSHSISVSFVGWMAHAKDRKISEIVADRDLSAWGGMSRGRLADLLLASTTAYDASTGADPTANVAAVITSFEGPWTTFKPVVEAWYDAGSGNEIGMIGFSWEREASTINPADTNWGWKVGVATSDRAAGLLDTGSLRAAGPATLQTFIPSTPSRFGLLQLFNVAASGGADGTRYAIDWSKLAVYGTQGFTLHTGEPGEPAGVYASDVFRYLIATYCPQLNADGVEDTDYVIQHCKFSRVFTYDALLELNKYHLNHLACWDNRTVHFRPYDLSDYQWEIRTDDPGVTFSPVGFTADDLFNGIEVTYQDILTGTEQLLSPDDYPELRDTDELNPWNQWGRDHWDDIPLSSPTTLEQALQIGRAALAEKNRPKTPGTLTATGYVRDRAGNLQPAHHMRAGDVICIVDFNEVNRLAVETDYDTDSLTMKIAMDLPFATLEALFDRQANAAVARGLS